MSAKYKTQHTKAHIKTLNRNMDLGNAQAIDQLSYTYSGNQLLVVDDALEANYENYGFKDNGYFEQEEYFYDKNGNLYKDLNKGIIDINYNHFNLPKHIRFGQNTTETKRIEYTYTADGSKLRKQTVIGETDAIKTDYLGSFIYENDEISFIQTSEGRLVPNSNGGFNYEYALKDHLGNTRVMFSQTGEILQDESYYPFGMSFGSALTYNNTDDSPANKYLYNGKEKQSDFGLDWYDYGARYYDAAIGRWHVIDNKAEKYFGSTPYAYAVNNPILFIDPDGNEIKIYYRDSKKKLRKFNFNGNNGKNAPKNSFVRNTIAAYNYNIKNGGGEKLKYAATNKDGIDIKLTSTENSSTYGYAETKYKNGTAVEGFVFWNPDKGLKTKDGVELSPATILEHETDHAVDDADNHSEHSDRVGKEDTKYDNKEERRVITGSEAKTAVSNGEAKKGWVRSDHKSGEYVEKKDWKYKNKTN